MSTKFKISALFFLFTLVYQCSFSQQNQVQSESNVLDSILKNTPAFRSTIINKDKYHIQVIYTRIKNHSSSPKLKQYTFNENEENYFYPASLVKFPLSIFAIEKIDSLKSKGVTLTSKLSIDSNYSCQSAVSIDLLSNDSIPTIQNYIKKALIVSDNESYNRLYEFVSPSYCQKRLSQLSFDKARIVTRFSSCDTSENKHTNAFHFYNEKGELIYTQNEEYNSSNYCQPIKNMCVGNKHYASGKVINGPKDFSKSNCFPLRYMHDLLIELIYPSLNSIAFSITESDREYLLKCLSSSPQNSDIIPIQTNPVYSEFMTNYLYYGAQKKAIKNKNLEIYNIVGQSYGFLSDVSYFKDSLNNIEFFLSAVIYTNSNETVGNGGYQYDTIGLPFLRDLGSTIYNFELEERKKKEGIDKSFIK